MAFDQESFNRDTITAFLLAYPRRLVVDVLKTLLLEEHADRRADGWQLFTGDPKDAPKGMDRMSVNGKLFVRAVQVPDGVDVSEPAHDRAKATPKSTAQSKKTDTTVRKANMLCPSCQSEMFREPICRGCKEGKAGFRVRLICGDNDEHTWIV